jgi:hypothetical protein
MWGVNPAAPLNTAHLGYGIGAVFVNLLIRPFLTQHVLPIDIEQNVTVSSVNQIKANSNIFIPYSITAGLCLIIAGGHIFFYIREQKSQRHKAEIRQVDYTAVNTNLENSSPYSPRTCGRGLFQYGLTLSIIFICYTFFIGGNDQTFSKFSFAYLKFEKFNISIEAASWGIILYWLLYSVCINMTTRNKMKTFFQLDWSISWCYCISFSLSKYVFKYCLVWRFMSCYCLAYFCMDNWFDKYKFIYSWCYDGFSLCTNLSIIIWFI